jgi:hypothetical protein
MTKYRRFFLQGKSVIFSLLLFHCAFSSASLSQQLSQITGKITNQSSGEALLGINIALVGTSLGASTDIDGKFTIHKIPAGTYDVRISGVGYTTKTVQKLRVTPESPTELNVNLSEETLNLQEVVISADEVHSSETSVLARRRKSATISDGVSAEQIKRSPDATSGDALKRVTGISIVDNKFVFVRGITDRYNETTLDGAPVTSTEVGKKSYSFDLLPANLIENTTVVKTPTPDLPGDFSGGLVQLNTQDFPSVNSLRISFGSSYNSVTSKQDFLRSQGGSRDWLGFDDGIRSYPGDQPNQNAIAKKLPNTWAPRNSTAPYNNSFSLALGEQFDLSSENSTPTQLGFISALSYRNTFQKNEKTNDNPGLNLHSVGTQNEYNVLWGAIANLSLKFDGLHKISFKNSFNQSGNDIITSAHIDDLGIPLEDKYIFIRWTQRSSYTGQLAGEHNLPSFGGLTLQWRGAVSSSRRDDPDGKEGVFYRDPTDPTQPFYADVNKREWAKLNERARSFGVDATLPLSSIKIKTGGFAQSKITDYEIRYFNITPSQYPNPIPDSIALLPLETIYSPANFGPGKFLFQESTRPEDTYNGDQSLYAGYLMVDVPFNVFSNKFRLVGGTRLENSEQNVYVPQEGGSTITSHHNNNDLLPSCNLTYFVNDVTNLRLAFSHSVNRPDFRELAKTGYYDFVTKGLIAGNPDLQRSLIHNYDVRLEIFPNIGELLALSYFDKHLTDPIEEFIQPNSSGYTRTWINSPSAVNSGWEIEIRKSLNFLGKYFGNFAVSGNYTRVQSEVKIPDKYTQKIVLSRPLQGQAPSVINLSLLFTEPTLGTSFSLLYNRFGTRIQAVGGQEGDIIYEESRDLFDLAVTQQILGNVEAKFTVKNLGNIDRVLTQGGHQYELTTIGRTFALQFSASL